jgi:hypothetical protein
MIGFIFVHIQRYGFIKPFLIQTQINERMRNITKKDHPVQIRLQYAIDSHLHIRWCIAIYLNVDIELHNNYSIHTKMLRTNNHNGVNCLETIIATTITVAMIIIKAIFVVFLSTVIIIQHFSPNPTSFPLRRPAAKPHDRFLNLVLGHGVLTAREGSCLKSVQPVPYNGEKVFVPQTIHTLSTC